MPAISTFLSQNQRSKVVLLAAGLVCPVEAFEAEKPLLAESPAVPEIVAEAVAVPEIVATPTVPEAPTVQADGEPTELPADFMNLLAQLFAGAHDHDGCGHEHGDAAEAPAEGAEEAAVPEDAKAAAVPENAEAAAVPENAEAQATPGDADAEPTELPADFMNLLAQLFGGAHDHDGCGHEHGNAVEAAAVAENAEAAAVAENAEAAAVAENAEAAAVPENAEAAAVPENAEAAAVPENAEVAAAPENAEAAAVPVADKVEVVTEKDAETGATQIQFEMPETPEDIVKVMRNIMGQLNVPQEDQDEIFASQDKINVA